MRQFIQEIFYDTLKEMTKPALKTVVVYAGRFQPFHKNHFEVYQWLVNKFGKEAVYIGTSNDTGEKSPFSFIEKKKIISTMFGIPANHIVRLSNVYAGTEIMKKFPSDSTIHVAALGGKDAERITGGKYFKPWKDNEQHLPYGKDRGYVITTPIFNTAFKGEMISGTLVRDVFKNPKYSGKQRQEFFTALYGSFNKNIYDLFKKKFGFNESIQFENIDYVICKECGKKTLQITTKHLYHIHNISLVEYKNKYPNAILQCESIKLFGKDNPIQKPENKEIFLKAVRSEEYRNKQKLGSTGRFHTEESKKKMSDNNAMNVEENRIKVSDAVKQSYVNNPELLKLRKEQFTEFRNSDEYRNKMENLGLWRRQEDKKLWEQYYTKVAELTQKSYTDYFYHIPNAKLRSREFHLDHKISVSYGFDNKIPPEIISHYKNLRIVPHSINESKGSKNLILLEDLLHQIQYSLTPLNTKILLQAGGAAGHMSHPFDDMNLTFGDLKNIIRLGLSGGFKTEQISEKLDGQNLQVTWKDGKLRAARNKGHVKNQGAASLDLSQLKDMFAGRGVIETAFTSAMADLESAISKLSDKDKLEFFQNGKSFLNFEIVYPATENVIPYGVSMLVFHGVTTYDDAGNNIDTNQKAATKLASIIKKVNADVQGTFQIKGPAQLSIKKTANFAKRQSYYVAKLNRLQQQFGLKDSNKIVDYHKKWWESYIDSMSKLYNVPLPDNVFTSLLNRWAFGDKSYTMSNLKKDLSVDDNSLGAGDIDKFVNWASGFDKKSHAEQLKTNIKPFEEIFLEVGAEILHNVSGLLSANPDAAINKLKTEIDAAASDITKSGDIYKISKLNTQLQKLQALGGDKAIAPTEGIVFVYKGKLMKFTGAFSPLNQILGILKFGN